MTGKNLRKLDNEAGGHRFQRVPPTEKKGRVHTSTITVAIMDGSAKADDVFMMRSDNDFEFQIFKSSGAGGQHRNKTSSAVRCIHIPTGLKQERTTKCQHSNRKTAKAAVLALLDESSHSQVNGKNASIRKHQVGSGMRGDKRRTYREQDDMVTDHVTGKTHRMKKVMRGDFMPLWS